MQRSLLCGDAARRVHIHLFAAALPDRPIRASPLLPTLGRALAPRSRAAIGLWQSARGARQLRRSSSHPRSSSLVHPQANRRSSASCLERCRRTRRSSWRCGGRSIALYVRARLQHKKSTVTPRAILTRACLAHAAHGDAYAEARRQQQPRAVPNMVGRLVVVAKGGDDEGGEDDACGSPFFLVRGSSTRLNACAAKVSNIPERARHRCRRRLLRYRDMPGDFEWGHLMYGNQARFWLCAAHSALQSAVLTTRRAFSRRR